MKLSTVILVTLGAALVQGGGRVALGRDGLAFASSVTVSYADLDVSKAAGARALQQRIRAAIRQVCSYDGLPDLHIRDLVEQCRLQAAAQADAQLAKSRVAAVTVQRPTLPRQ